jgi:hypothetical protein
VERVVQNSEQSAKVLISSASFALWFQSEPLLRRLELVLCDALLEDLLIDGIELALDFSELGQWTRGRSARPRKVLPGSFGNLSPELQQRLLRLRHNTVHLAPLKNLHASRRSWLIERLRMVADTTGITEFTVHPDEVTDDAWQQILDQLPADIVLSVENMDPRKRNYRTLGEMQALLDTYPQLRLTFDLCHWLEEGGSSSSVEMLEFFKRNGERISKIHFSVPRSMHESYGDIAPGFTSHFLAASSDVWVAQAFFDALPQGIRWVSEGLVPLRGVKLLKAELYQLNRLSYRPATERRAAVG